MDYTKMDETELRLHGVGECRISLVEQLRRRGYSIFYISVALLYGLMVIAAFACHGIWYEERAEAYFERG